jgi:hypothetical protein
MMRRLMLFGTMVAILGLGLLTWLWSDPCRPTGYCNPDQCTPLRPMRLKCCVPDNGCYLNPWEPDNQWWCEDILVYRCPAGRCYTTVAAWECGPCCDTPGEVIPLPTPTPAPTP